MIEAGSRKQPLGDVQYTPRHAVLPIIKFLPRHAVVGCPFDAENSEFVIALKEAGHEVVFSHIFMGQDFFEYEPPKWDMIVSNPPFSLKQQVVERCLALGKPFALLLSNLWLHSRAPCRFLKEQEMQILLFDKRINYAEKNAVYFGSSYFCHKVLPKQIVFEHLATIKGERSRMWLDVEKLSPF